MSEDSADIISSKNSTLIKCANLARPSSTGSNKFVVGNRFMTRKYVANT